MSRPYEGKNVFSENLWIVTALDQMPRTVQITEIANQEKTMILDRQDFQGNLIFCKYRHESNCVSKK